MAVILVGKICLRLRLISGGVSGPTRSLLLNGVVYSDVVDVDLFYEYRIWEKKYYK